jgi:hypothetical protein
VCVLGMAILLLWSLLLHLWRLSTVSLPDDGVTTTPSPCGSAPTVSRRGFSSRWCATTRSTTCCPMRWGSTCREAEVPVSWQMRPKYSIRKLSRNSRRSDEDARCNVTVRWPRTLLEGAPAEREQVQKKQDMFRHRRRSVRAFAVRRRRNVSNRLHASSFPSCER